MPTYEKFSGNPERVSQRELETAVETLSNILYLLENRRDLPRETSSYLDIAEIAMNTVRRATQEGREALKLVDRDGV